MHQVVGNHLHSYLSPISAVKNSSILFANKQAPAKTVETKQSQFS